MANIKISQLGETLTLLPGDIFPVVINPLTIPETKKLTFNNLSSSILNLVDHGSISGLADDDHTQYFNTTRHTLVLHTSLGLTPSTRQIISGSGLSGGGDLSADRTLAIGQGTGILVGNDDVSINLAANLTWTGNHIFQGSLDTRNIVPELTDSYDLGTSLKLWRKGYLSEMEALLFVENSISVIGGWFYITKNQGTFSANVNDTQTTIDFGTTMTLSDFVVIRTSLSVEYIQVGTLVSGTTYNVTRNLDGSGANSWPAGTVFAVLGYSGDGRIELNAHDTPRISILEQGSSYNIQTERIRLGDLVGWQTAGFTGYGIAIGNYSGGESLVYSPTGGLEIRGTIKADDGYLQNLTVQGLLSLNTSGELRAGNTTNGLRFGYLSDGYYLRGIGGGITQVEIRASDGALYAGAGSLKLNANGFSFYGSGAAGAPRLIKWFDQSSGTDRQLGSVSADYGGGDAILWLAANKRTGDPWASSQVIMMAYDQTTAKEVRLYVRANSQDVYIDGSILADGTLDAIGEISQKRSDGGHLPLVPNTPWRFTADTIKYLMFCYNPTHNLNQQMFDLSPYQRHLTPHTAWNGSIGFGSDKSIMAGIEYFGTNGTNLYMNRVGEGGIINGWQWVYQIMWFYPTSLGANRGLFQFGTSNPNYLAYININSNVVWDAINSSNTTHQLISSNTVIANKWNYIYMMFGANNFMKLNLNGTITSRSTPPTGVLRNATGDLRLGWENNTGPLYGALGFTMLSQIQDEVALQYLIDISKPWHGK